MTGEKSILDHEEILQRLPHRFPFMLVDRVLEVPAGESIVALKNVSANEAFFQGHFPGHAVMPGVLVVEALAQAGGVLAWETAQQVEDPVRILYLIGVDKARFKHPVRPGDQLTLRANLVMNRRGLWKYECEASVDGRVVVEVEILMATSKDA